MWPKAVHFASLGLRGPYHLQNEDLKSISQLPHRAAAIMDIKGKGPLKEKRAMKQSDSKYWLPGRRGRGAEGMGKL